MKPKAEVGVFGGSGFYRFFKKARELKVRARCMSKWNCYFCVKEGSVKVG